LNQTDMVMPVMLRIEYEDGSTEDLKLPAEVWYNRHVINERLRTDKTVIKVTLDPNHELPDANRRNNVWPAPADSE
jgi:cell division protein YceG involved in septum cleavage